MKKSWNTLLWILILAAQFGIGYALVTLSNTFTIRPRMETIPQFLMVPLGIWLGYLVGVYALGMLVLVLKKVEPVAAGLRLFTTAVLGTLPMLILIFNAVTIGVENQQQFQTLVMARMVPYYTNLCAVFALLGFYITVWWHKVTPKTEKA